MAKNGSERDDGYVSDFDNAFADVPVVGWLLGSDARRNSAQNRYDQRRSRESWTKWPRRRPASMILRPNTSRSGPATNMAASLVLGRNSALQGWARRRLLNMRHLANWENSRRVVLRRRSRDDEPDTRSQRASGRRAKPGHRSADAGARYGWQRRSNGGDDGRWSAARQRQRCRGGAGNGWGSSASATSAQRSGGPWRSHLRPACSAAWGD
jgi:hypothetical protein